jgi:hypothetical protein
MTLRSPSAARSGLGVLGKKEFATCLVSNVAAARG